MAVNLPKSEAFWALSSQAAFVVITFLLGICVWGTREAVSLALGGLVCVLPNFYLYRKIFSHFGASKAAEIVKGFYWGEAGKIVFTVILFIVAFQIPYMLPGFIFAGYIGNQLVFWLAPLFISRIKLKQEKSGK